MSLSGTRDCKWALNASSTVGPAEDTGLGDLRAVTIDSRSEASCLVRAKSTQLSLSRLGSIGKGIGGGTGGRVARVGIGGTDKDACHWVGSAKGGNYAEMSDSIQHS